MILARYWDYNSVYFFQPTEQNFNKLLRSINSLQVISASAVIGSLLQHWARQLPGGPVYEALLKLLFPSDMAARLVSGLPEQWVFSRRQLLGVIKYAISARAEGAAVLWHDEVFWRQYGTLLLMVNGRLHYNLRGNRKDRAKNIRNLFVEVIPVVEDAGFAVMSKIARSSIMMDEIAPNLNDDPSYIDIASRFRDLTGITLRQFQAIAFGLLTRWTITSAHQLRFKDAFYLEESWFSSTKIPIESVRVILQWLSGDLDWFFKNNDSTRVDDFTPFRRKPLLRLESKYIPLDFGLLGESFEAIPFWTINNADKSGSFRQFWGRVFEAYIADITKKSVAERINRVIPNPQFEGGNKELCDLLILSGDSAVLIETKAIMFSAESKYSGSAATFFRYFHERFVRNKRGEPKGTRQLQLAIKRAFVDQDPVHGVDLSHVRNVYSLIVTLDNIGDNLLFSDVLNLYFNRDSLKRMGLNVAPMLGMSSETYEFMIASGNEVPIHSLLSDWLSSARGYIGNYHMVNSPISSLLENRKNELLRTHFSRMISEALHELGLQPH